MSEPAPGSASASTPAPAPAAVGPIPRPSASVVLLRDVAGAAGERGEGVQGGQGGGVEVLMLRRHAESESYADAFVFPGGKTDGADAALAVEAHLDQPLAVLHQRLGESGIDAATAGGFFVAALRETFEESGLLLVQDASAGLLAEAAARLAAGVPFNALLAELGLRLQASALLPWSRWITPQRGLNKRFDTRFFAARAPAQGIARHDGRETTEAVWLRPRPALERYWNGDIVLAAPQVMTLAHLSRFATVDSALDEARGRPPALVEPHLSREDGLEAMCYPGDREHPVQARAMPGTTRLLVRNRRAEPPAGFEGFFS